MDSARGEVFLARDVTEALAEHGFSSNAVQAILESTRSIERGQEPIRLEQERQAAVEEMLREWQRCIDDGGVGYLGSMAFDAAERVLDRTKLLGVPQPESRKDLEVVAAVWTAWLGTINVAFEHRATYDNVGMPWERMVTMTQQALDSLVREGADKVALTEDEIKFDLLRHGYFVSRILALPYVERLLHMRDTDELADSGGGD